MRENEPGSRAPTYRAPTWSWASIDGPVVLVSSYRGHGTNMKYEIRSEIRLIDSSFRIAEDGQLTSAEIVLYGRLRPGFLTAIGGARGQTVFTVTDSANSGAVKRGEVWLDPPTVPPKNPELMHGTTHGVEVAREKQHSIYYQMLHVSTRKRNDAKSAHKIYDLLAVEEIEGRDGEFVRVGAGYVDTDSWFNNDHTPRRIRIF